jgi:3-methyladenine DNA glycosylase AlkD
MPTLSANSVGRALRQYGSPERARASARFFKTGPGQYGAGDVFIGVTVPEQRQIVRQFRDLSSAEIKTLLASPIHEYRLTALLILVDQFGRANPAQQRRIVTFYLRQMRRVNNWDLVDSSAAQILGTWLLSQPNAQAVLTRMARSKSIWERRIAIVATYAFIRAGQFTPTLTLARQLLTDEQDLMHKATGWMLREMGKRDESVLRQFLDQNATRMPRTMLRYAIERLSPALRRQYLVR